MKVHLAHILVPHLYQAEDLYRKLEQGENFEELARKHSTCGSASRGGDLGSVNEERLDEDFVSAAKELQPQQYSKPVRTKFGYHLIKKL